MSRLDRQALTFVDTSALIAFFDRDAARHREVVATMTPLLEQGSGVTHSHIVVETEALIRAYHGGSAVRRLLDDLVPLLDVAWITPDLHAVAVQAHLANLRKRASLVDQMSFAVMRKREIQRALTLDRQFAIAGFWTLP